MKRPGLSRPLSSATLFLATALALNLSSTLRADDAAPAKSAPKLSEREIELIKRYDKNGDGRLDATELAAAHETMRQENPMRGPEGKLPPAAANGALLYRRMLENFDRDKDGKLTGDEQTAAMDAMKRRAPEIYDRLLQRADVNNDGKLDEAERTSMFDLLASLPPPKADAEKVDGAPPMNEAPGKAEGAPQPLTPEQRENLQKLREDFQRRRAERMKTQEATPASAAAPTAPAEAATPAPKK